jgi:hypothetical protein
MRIPAILRNAEDLDEWMVVGLRIGLVKAEKEKEKNVKKCFHFISEICMQFYQTRQEAFTE